MMRASSVLLGRIRSSVVLHSPRPACSSRHTRQHGLPCSHVANLPRSIACKARSSFERSSDEEKEEDDQERLVKFYRSLKQTDEELWDEVLPYYLGGAAVIATMLSMPFWIPAVVHLFQQRV